MKKRIILGAVVVGVLYVATYVVLSVTGGWVITQTGNLRTGISQDDAFVWMPRYGWCQKYTWPDGTRSIRAEGVGYLLAPLILSDQKWVHPTKTFLSPDFTPVQGFTPPATNSWHPMMREALAEEMAAQKVQPTSAGDVANRAAPEK